MSEENAEILNIFRECFNAALDSDARTLMDEMQTDAESLRAGRLSVPRARASLQYREFEVEVLNRLFRNLRFRIKKESFRLSVLAAVEKFAASHRLDAMTSEDGKESDGLKLLYKFLKWHRKERNGR